MSLPESLERAASELDGLADQIRPANGDPHRLLEELHTEDACQLLAWILTEEAGAAEELIDAWGDVEEGAAVLLAVSETGIAKPGRKLLRRARHRLRSQGVVVTVPAAAKSSPESKESTRRALAASDRWQAAHLSPPDFRGARVGYLVETHPAGGARLFEAHFDDARGILDFKIYNAGRSKVRSFLRSLTSATEQRLFEVDGPALRALIRRASHAQPNDRPLPSAFVEWRGRLFPDSLDSEPTPGGVARARLGFDPEPKDPGAAPAAADALDAVSREIREGRIGPWPPATAWVSDWMDKGRQSVEGIDDENRADRIEAWIEEVTDALAAETAAKQIAHHLDEMAWVRGQSGDDDAARQLLLASDALSTSDSAARRLTRARVESLFSPLLAELRVVEISPLDAAAGDGTH
jgi:hypothetical protein